MSAHSQPPLDQDIVRQASLRDAAFDLRMRASYRQASAELSARTRAQLQLRVRTATAARARTASISRRVAWGLAAAGSLALLFGLGPRLQAPPAARMATASVAGDRGGLVATLDEPPDLYLWVASDDAAAMTSEQAR